MSDASERLPPAELLVGVMQRRDEANALSRGLVGRDNLLFGDASLSTPPLVPPELGFLRTVAWLFVMYHEVGIPGVAFVASLFEGYSVAGGNHARDHIELVAQLRTYHQHNLSPLRPRDRTTEQRVEDWCERACGSRWPGTDDQWTACLARLLADALALFQALVDALRHIEGDDAREDVVEQWKFRAERHHPPHDFDPIVAEAAADMGRGFLDASRFRKRFYEKWVDALGALDVGYDFALEARRLVELSLLTEGIATLPITGTDVIRQMQIEPGPEVGRVLARARVIFEAEPCASDELIARLRSDLELPPRE